MDNIIREIQFSEKKKINWTKEIENIDTKIKDLIDFVDLTKETRKMKLNFKIRAK